MSETHPIMRKRNTDSLAGCIGILLCFIIVNTTRAQEAYRRTTGLVNCGPAVNSKAGLPVYSDSACRHLMRYINIEATNCPTCDMCAEPTSFYKGDAQPFECFAGNVWFPVQKVLPNGYRIALNEKEQSGYIRAQSGVYKTWREYIVARSKAGDFLNLYPEDSVICYQQPDQHAPRALHTYLEGRFHPIDIKGTWMKLGFRNNKGKTVYGWIVWCTTEKLVRWFAFNPF